jgi:hypothetical protein
MLLRDGFRGTGSGDAGAIRLLDAHISGTLEMDGALLANDSGPALKGDRLRVDGSLFLRGGFRAKGASKEAAVLLLGARISGQFSMINAVMNNTEGLFLNLAGATVNRSVFLPSTMLCPAGARTSNGCSHAGGHIDLHEFTFGSIRNITWQQWLHLIRCHTYDYWPGPYQQLAAAERAAGHDGNARRILIAQQQDLRARGNLGGRMARFSHWVWGLVAGYGYRARRTAVALLIALALAGGLGWWAGHWSTGGGHHAAERTVASGALGTPCSPVEQIGLGIDRGLPLASAGIRSRCDLDTASTAGQVFTVAIWVLQALVWALATLALAGYTGLIRKPA